MFTTLLPEIYKVEDIFDAWDSAAHDATLAWDKWLASPTRDRGNAHAGYSASLDREEHAAEVLATAVRSRHPRVDRCGSPVAVRSQT
jgi:hypothetical protein